MTNNDYLLTNLKKYRLFYKYLQKDVAKVLGISNKDYSRFERGVTVIPYEYLEKLAELYDTDVSEFYSEIFVWDYLKDGDSEEIFDSISIDNMFPLFKSKKAMENKNFKAAFNIHTAILYSTNYNVNDYHICLGKYKNAVKEGSSLAAANFISMFILFFIENIANKKETYDINKGRVESNKLKDAFSEMSRFLKEENAILDEKIDSYKNDFAECMHIIKNNLNLLEWFYFNLVFSKMLALDKDGDKDKKTSGLSEILYDMAEYGNKYAKAWVDFFHTFIDEKKIEEDV